MLLTTVYNKLATKIDTTDSGRFVLKTQYNTDKSCLEKKIDKVSKKIFDTNGFVKKKNL